MICAYGSQNGRPEQEKYHFYGILVCERDLHNKKELVFGLREFNEHVSKEIDGFEGVWEWNCKNPEGRTPLEFCEKKERYLADIWYQKKETRKVTFSSRGNDIIRYDRSHTYASLIWRKRSIKS